MSKKGFNNLEDMYKRFKADAIESVNDVAPPVMKKTMQKAIEIEVYSTYEPSLYTDRRYDDGGLKDIDNMKHELIIEDKKIKIVLKNYTKGDNRGIYPNTQPNIYIDTIVVTGKGYNWKNSDIARFTMERDFYKKTEELLRTSNIINEIKKEMKRKGW